MVVPAIAVLISPLMVRVASAPLLSVPTFQVLVLESHDPTEGVTVQPVGTSISVTATL